VNSIGYLSTAAEQTQPLYYVTILILQIATFVHVPVMKNFETVVFCNCKSCVLRWALYALYSYFCNMLYA